MVSQNQDGGGWEDSPASRAGSLLSLDGRSPQVGRPIGAKTPPSYYDAVRSRHSLSQPKSPPKHPDKQQQIKYNSLPRPLPQRYPPLQVPAGHAPWPADLPGQRLQYDSPPKPANRVPLQVHQDPRAPVHQNNGLPRAEPRANGLSRQSSIDSNRGIEMLRKEGYQTMSVRMEGRPPPRAAGRPAPRAPPPAPADINGHFPPRGEPSQNGLLRKCYPAAPLPSRYTPARPPSEPQIEPRYSKSGTLGPPREARPMPPPMVMLRTGPLGTYPDAETLKQQQQLQQQQQLAYNSQIFVDTGSYSGANSYKGNGPSSYNNNGPSSYSGNAPSSYNGNGPSGYNNNGPNSYSGSGPNSYNGNGSNSYNNSGPSNYSGNGPSSYVNNQPPASSYSKSQGEAYHNASPKGNTRHRNGVRSQTLPNNLREYPADPRTRRPSERMYENHRTPNPYEDAIYANQMVPSSSQTSLYENTPRHSRRNTQENFPPENLYANHPVSPSHSDSQGVDMIASNHAYSKMSGSSFGGRQQEAMDSLKAARGPPSGSRSGKPPPPPPQKPNMSQHEVGRLKESWSNGRLEDLPKMKEAWSINARPEDLQKMKDTWSRNASNGRPEDALKTKENWSINARPEDLAKLKESWSTNSRTGELSKMKETSRPEDPPKFKETWSITSRPQDLQKLKESWIPEDHAKMKDSWRPEDLPAGKEEWRPELVKPKPRFANGMLSYTNQQLSNVPAYQCVLNELSSLQSVDSSDSSTLSYKSGSSSTTSQEFLVSQDDKEDEGRSSAGRVQRDKSASTSSLLSDTSSSSLHRRHDSRSSINEDDPKKKPPGFAVSPWEREEKEKQKRDRVCAVRAARDREIALLEGAGPGGRDARQDEWLRVLRLEREFQRRADELADDSDHDSDNGDDPPATLTVIPHERMGQQLLQELRLDSASKKSPCGSSRSPVADKHFVPLDVDIPEDDIPAGQQMPLANNILKISDQQGTLPADKSRMAPVPAPRSSRGYPFEQTPRAENGDSSSPHSSSLAQLDISDSSALFCSSEDDLDKKDWAGEVHQSPFQPRKSNDSTFDDARSYYSLDGFPQNGADHSRIYENINPPDYQTLRSSSSNGFGCHTLPKSSGALNCKEDVQCRKVPTEKKFPAMGVSSTLSKKSNGYIVSDADILPSLYATSIQTRNVYAKEVPSDLANKSPEFKKMWNTRPEKLTFQDKIRKFSIQAGEDDAPRDKVKNSRAQRELEMKFSDAQKARAQKAAAES